MPPEIGVYIRGVRVGLVAQELKCVGASAIPAHGIGQRCRGGRSGPDMSNRRVLSAWRYERGVLVSEYEF